MFSNVANRQYIQLQIPSQKLYKELQRDFGNSASTPEVAIL